MSRRINKSRISILRHISPEELRVQFLLLFHFFLFSALSLAKSSVALILYDSLLLLIGSRPAKVRLLLENPPRPVFIRVEETRESGRETACESSLLDGIIASFDLDQFSYQTKLAEKSLDISKIINIELSIIFLYRCG